MVASSLGPLPRYDKSQRIGKGGFASVYPDPSDPQRCIKVFKQPIQGRQADQVQRLTSVDQWARPSDREFLTTRCAWPLGWYTSGSGITGTAMPLAPKSCWFEFRRQGIARRQLMQMKFLTDARWWQSRFVQSAKPDVTPAQRHELAIECVTTIETLHRNGLAFGDISSNNICANLGTAPSVFFLDADSIGLPLEIADANIQSPGWEVPNDLDATRQDRQRMALLIWRLFTETPSGYPTSDETKPLLHAPAFDSRVLFRVFQTGDSEDLEEAAQILRRLRGPDAQHEALQRALASGFARLVYDETVGRSSTEALDAHAKARTQIDLEDEIEAATRADRRRLLNRAAFSDPTFILDIRPETASESRPNNQGQLRDLILDAEFTTIATHLAGQGLGTLETDTWLPRAIQHALITTEHPQARTDLMSGGAQILWTWPQASFVNVAVVDVYRARRRLSREQIPRHHSEAEGRAEIQIGEGDYQVHIWSAIRSPSGGVFPCHRPVALDVSVPPPPTPARPSRPPTLDPGASPPKPTPIQVVDPIAVAAQQNRDREAARKLRRRRVLTGIGASALFTLIGIFGWRLAENSVSESNARDLVFASDRDGDWEIYLKRDQLAQQLTSNDYDDLNPQWDPTGRFIAFESFRGTDWELMRINADGTDEGMFTDNESNEKWFSWAPDSLNFVYASDRDGDWEIYLRRGYLEQQLTFNDHNDLRPQWDPTGRFIAFESFRGTDWELMRINADGTDEGMFTDNESNEKWFSWAPDGLNFVYASDRDGDWEIFVSRPGYSEQQLTFNDHDDVDPVWDPKGRFIVFSSSYDGDWEVLRMRVDGSDVRAYTINTDNDQTPDVK